MGLTVPISEAERQGACRMSGSGPWVSRGRSYQKDVWNLKVGKTKRGLGM